jgi:hypothetical protein
MTQIQILFAFCRRVLFDGGPFGEQEMRGVMLRWMRSNLAHTHFSSSSSVCLLIFCSTKSLNCPFFSICFAILLAVTLCELKLFASPSSFHRQERNSECALSRRELVMRMRECSKKRTRNISYSLQAANAMFWRPIKFLRLLVQLLDGE